MSNGIAIFPSPATSTTSSSLSPASLSSGATPATILINGAHIKPAPGPQNIPVSNQQSIHYTPDSSGAIQMITNAHHHSTPGYSMLGPSNTLSGTNQHSINMNLLQQRGMVGAAVNPAVAGSINPFTSACPQSAPIVSNCEASSMTTSGSESSNGSSSSSLTSEESGDESASPLSKNEEDIHTNNNSKTKVSTTTTTSTVTTNKKNSSNENKENKKSSSCATGEKSSANADEKKPALNSITTSPKSSNEFLTHHIDGYILKVNKKQ